MFLHGNTFKPSTTGASPAFSHGTKMFFIPFFYFSIGPVIKKSKMDGTVEAYKVTFEEIYNEVKDLVQDIKAEYKYELLPTKNYYFTVNDILYLYHKYSKKFVSALIIDKKTLYYDTIVIKVELPNDTVISDYIIYKPNSEKPYGAYELNDGTGRYLWRES